MRSERRLKAREVDPPRSIEGRQPPHDLDAEAAVLSAVMVEGTGKLLDDVAGTLSAEHFYAESHRRIYEAALALHAAGQPTDVVQVGTWLKSRERIEQVGGMGYLTEILNASPALANVVAHAAIVRDRAKARAVILAAQAIVSRGYSDYGEASDFAAESAEALSVVAQEDAPKNTRHINDILKDVAKALIERGKSGRRMAGKPTGIDRYDRMTAGLHDGDLTIVAARPGMGKTSLAMNLATSVATGSSDAEAEGVLVVSLEMPDKQLGGRTLFSEARVDVGKMRSGEVSPLDFQRVIGAVGRVGKLPIWVHDGSTITLPELRAEARRVQAEIARGKTPAKRLGLIVVDYIQLMTGNADSREQEISMISRGLKSLAKELRAAVVALSQLNRSVESRTDKRPQLSDLRESGAIEQDADNICFVYRDDYYTKEFSKEKGISELIIAKQRNGPTGTVKAKWDGEHTRFDNLPEGDYE